MTDAPSGERFGEFVKVSLLGEGSFGEVWKAWDASLSRWVALKFLKSEDREELKRFLREAQTAASLTHANIASIYRVGEHDGRHFIAMALVDGQTFETAPRHDPREIARRLRDASRGVAHAHARGIVHRDLKPANLMIDGEGRVFVMDFGLSRQLDVKSSLTMSGMMVGTAAYMSPEQARGQPADPRSDVYSLGATLYELLADRPPFHGDTILDLLMHVTTDDPPPIHHRERDLVTIAMKCLEKDAALRYRDARELADDLTRYLDREPIQARAASGLYRLSKRIAKRKWIVILAAAAIVLLGAVGFIAPRWRRETLRRQEAEFYLPLENKLDLLRMKFYQPDLQLEAEFPEYEQLIGTIQKQMAATGECAAGWHLIGRCREVLGDFKAADAAYDRALAVDPAHARTLLAKGRASIESIIYRRFRVRGVSSSMRTAGKIAVGLIRRAGSTRTFESDVAEGYLAVIESRPFAAAPMMERWRTHPFVEEFILIEALTQNVPAMREASGRVAKAIPSYPTAHFWHGVTLRDTGFPREGLDHLERTLRINPRFADALVERAQARDRLGDTDGAISDYDAAIAREPTLSVAFVNRGHVRAKRGDFDGARRDFEEGMRVDPDNALAWVNRGYSREREGDMDGAMKDYEEAVRRDPECMLAHLNRGVMRERRGDRAGSQEDIQAALNLDDGSPEAHVVRGIVRMRAGNFDDAAQDFDAALRFDTSFALAYVNRAILKSTRGDKAGARDDVDRAVKCDPSCAEAYSWRAVSHAWQGEFDLAEADVETALKLDRNCATAYVNRGALRQRRGDRAGAMADYESAVRFDPTLDMAYVDRGALRGVNGDRAGAMADFEAALKCDPRCAMALANRGMQKLAAGDADAALVDIEAALKIDPNCALAYVNRAIIHERRGRPDRAYDDYTEAIRSDPWMCLPYLNRGKLRSARKDDDGALEDYNSAIRADPRLAVAYANRGAVKRRRGDEKGAVADYEEAIRIDPRCPEAYANRGLVRHNKGELKAAVADYRTALEVAPADWPFRAQVQQLLDQASKE